MLRGDTYLPSDLQITKVVRIPRESLREAPAHQALSTLQQCATDRGSKNLGMGFGISIYPIGTYRGIIFGAPRSKNTEC